MGKLDHIKEVRGCILTSRGLHFNSVTACSSKPDLALSATRS